MYVCTYYRELGIGVNKRIGHPSRKGGVASRRAQEEPVVAEIVDARKGHG
jgi:hypothetical protein